MMGGDMNPEILSTVDEILMNIYREFEEKRSLESLPTFVDFYEELRKKREPLAIALANVLKIYVTGSLSIFSKRTNVDTSNRLISYNTSKLGSLLSTSGSFLMFDAIWNRIAKNKKIGKRTWIYIDEVHLLFNAIWNRIAKNKKIGKRTWIYIDEVHLLFSSDAAIKRIDNMYRRYRKYLGTVTSMTQSTGDTLRWHEARTMIGKSGFIVVMNQQEHERREAISLLSIPETMVSNIANVGAGQGIIFHDKMLIPFENLWPKENTLYELMTTNGEEVAEITERWRNDPKKKFLVE